MSGDRAQASRRAVAASPRLALTGGLGGGGLGGGGAPSCSITRRAWRSAAVAMRSRWPGLGSGACNTACSPAAPRPPRAPAATSAARSSSCCSSAAGGTAEPMATSRGVCAAPQASGWSPRAPVAGRRTEDKQGRQFSLRAAQTFSQHMRSERTSGPRKHEAQRTHRAAPRSPCCSAHSARMTRATGSSQRARTRAPVRIGQEGPGPSLERPHPV